MNTAIRLAQIDRECVACGCCVSVCPKGAIRIDSGVIAQIDNETCIGCGKCARVCPAAVITVVERRAVV